MTTPPTPVRTSRTTVLDVGLPPQDKYAPSAPCVTSGGKPAVSHTWT